MYYCVNGGICPKISTLFMDEREWINGTVSLVIFKALFNVLVLT